MLMESHSKRAAPKETALESNCGFVYGARDSQKMSGTLEIECLPNEKFFRKLTQRNKVLRKKNYDQFTYQKPKTGSQLESKGIKLEPNEMTMSSDQINRLIHGSIFGPKTSNSNPVKFDNDSKKKELKKTKRVKTNTLIMAKKVNFEIVRFITFLDGFQNANEHSLSHPEFIREYEELLSSILDFNNMQSELYPHFPKQANIFSCERLSLIESHLDPFVKSNSLRLLSESNVLTKHSMLTLMLLITINFQKLISDPTLEIKRIIEQLLRRKNLLAAVPFLRTLNAIFKKLPAEINEDDIGNLLARMTNSFGYVEKLFKELILFAEIEIVNRSDRSLNLENFYPTRITQNATFQGACRFYLKREPQLAKECLFFVEVKDLLTSVKIASGLPCMVNLNQRKMALLRNYIGNRKFADSEQQIIFMYLAQEINLPQ